MNDEKISQIKTNFNAIKELRINVMSCFNALETKQLKLKKTTTEFITNNQHNLFIFGLDSFQFQSKLIDYEYADMKKYYFALNNRMYCEYYKLYKLVLSYAEEIIGSNHTITTLKANNIFPVYKDLEPFKQYDFEMISELHKTILVLLNDLHEHIIEKETKLKTFVAKQQTGLNINNFVNTYDYDIAMIRQKRTLYISYLEFFHNIHTKHFKRFSKKMKLMNDYLDEDIQFDEGMYVDSTPSFDTDDNFVVEEEKVDSPIIEKKGFTSLFKSKMKNVMNTLKLTKPKIVEQPHVSDISHLLHSISSTCDTLLQPPQLELLLQEEPLHEEQQPLHEEQQPLHEEEQQPLHEEEQQPLQEQPLQEEEQQPLQEEEQQPLHEEPLQEQPLQEEPLQEEQPLQEEPLHEEPLQEPIESQSTDDVNIVMSSIQEEGKKKRKYTKRK
jgi:hypothetical protein